MPIFTLNNIKANVSEIELYKYPGMSKQKIEQFNRENNAIQT